MADQIEIDLNRRGDDAGSKALGKATSLTARVAPDRVPNKKIRSQDIEEVELRVKESKALIEKHKNDDFIDKMPTLFDLMGSMMTPKEKVELSIQTDLYESIPRFSYSPVKREMGKYLPILKRSFEHRDREFHMEITPARIGEKDYYAGAKEELIEMELVQMSSEKGMPTGMGLYGVKFSLYELRKRLKVKGHTYSILQIKEGLHIMSRSTLILKADFENGDSVVEESMFASIGMRTWSDWKELGRTSECFVKFNSLHVKAMKANQYQLYNEKKAMEISESLTRWMYKYVFRNWVRAKFLYQLEWSLSSIIRDSGISGLNLSRARTKVEKAFDDLAKMGIFIKWELLREHKVSTKGRSKTSDVVYGIQHGIVLQNEMKRLNQLKRDLPKTQKLIPDSKPSNME